MRYLAVSAGLVAFGAVASKAVAVDQVLAMQGAVSSLGAAFGCLAAGLAGMVRLSGARR